MSIIIDKIDKLKVRQKVYGYLLVGFSFLVLTIITVKTLAPEIGVDAASQTASQTVGPYTMSMSNDSVATISITPTDSQAVYTGTNNLSVTNTCPSGASITMTTNSTSSNSLTRTGTDSLTKEIAATTTTALDNNSWGYALNSSSTYYAVPKKDATAATIYNATAAQTSALSVPVKFGVKVDNNIPSGTYTNDVLYTMTPKSGCLIYSLTWDMNSGTAKSGVTYPSSLSWGATIDLSTLTPTRSGYTFTGWSNGSSTFTGSETAANLNSGNANSVTVTAQWTPGIYAITLNNQSATSAGTTTIYEKYATGWYSNSAATTSISSITIPTKTNYTFKGYYTSTGCSGTQRINASGTITAGNTTYTGTGTLYACWEASATGLHSITTMQEMTSSVCSATTTPAKTATTFDWDGSHTGDTSYVPRKKLQDTRDGNYYLVSKLADGNCWMSQSLALDLTANTSVVTSTTSGGTSTFTPTNSTQTSTGTTWAQNGGNVARSYHPQSSEAYYRAGTTKSSSPTGSGDTYLWEKAGNYYNWYTATGGTGTSTMTSSDATASICPKGWRLPPNGTASKSYYYLITTTYGLASSSAGSTSLRAAPLNFNLSGYYHYSSGAMLGQGSYGFYWSSTAYSSANNAYYLYFTTSSFYPQNYSRKGHGFSVRCVAL